MFAPRGAGYVRRSKRRTIEVGLRRLSTLGKGCPMTNAPGSTGTTVTLFGDADPLDRALSDQLSQRGVKTHSVSVPTGWLRSATHAIMRLDTVAGADALQALVETKEPRSHVIAVGLEPTDPAESDRVREMCRSCGLHHDISLIWHPPLTSEAAPQGTASSVVATNALAATVADEVVEHASVGHPAFVTKAVRLEHDLH